MAGAANFAKWEAKDGCHDYHPGSSKGFNRISEMECDDRCDSDMTVCQNLVPLVNIKIAGKWMFIPLKMVSIGIDPYPYARDYRMSHGIGAPFPLWAVPHSISRRRERIGLTALARDSMEVQSCSDLYILHTCKIRQNTETDASDSESAVRSQTRSVQKHHQIRSSQWSTWGSSSSTSDFKFRWRRRHRCWGSRGHGGRNSPPTKCTGLWRDADLAEIKEEWQEQC